MINKFSILVLIGVLGFSACLDIEVAPIQSPKFKENLYGDYSGAYQYWPIRQNIQWVFDVYTDSSGQLSYIFQDTLKYTKDTNIAKSGYIYFNVFNFQKKPFDLEFIIGKYLPNSLYYFINGVTYEAFNLEKIKDNLDSIYSFDGTPFNNDYLVSYQSPILKNYNSAIGNFDVVSSTISFNKKYNNGIKRAYKQEIKLAKDKGIVAINYSYKSFDYLGFQDSSINLVYKINQILY